MKRIADSLNPCPVLKEQIESELMDNPPVNVHKGQVIKNGFSKELDEWRHIIKNSKEILLDIQKNEALQTGISNLKIGFNSVFG